MYNELQQKTVWYNSLPNINTI